MVTAYNTRTRVFQDIPEHWIDHPIWGTDWTPTPPPEAREPLWAHPRSRGENASARALARGPGGSSPLTRGKPCMRAARRGTRGLIPAHAGKTR